MKEAWKGSIKKIIETYSQIIPILLFSTSFLGGLSQIIILYSFSPTLLHFFSFEKLILDGVFILIGSILLFLYFYLILKLLNHFNNLKFKYEYFIKTIYYMLFLAINFLTLRFAQQYIILVLTSTIANTVIIFISFINYFFEKILKKNYFVYQINDFNFFYSFYIISAFTCAIIPMLIRKDYTNISNVESYINKVEKEYSTNNNKAHLIYSNDKYLFFEINSRNKKIFIIKDFEESYK